MFKTDWFGKDSWFGKLEVTSFKQPEDKISDGRPRIICVAADYINCHPKHQYKKYLQEHAVVRTTQPAWEYFGPLETLTKGLRFERFGGYRDRLAGIIEAHRALINTFKKNNPALSKAEVRRRATKVWLENKSNGYNLSHVLANSFGGYDFRSIDRCWACRALYKYHPFQTESEEDGPLKGREVEKFRKSTGNPLKPKLESKYAARACAEALVAIGCKEIVRG